MEKVNILLVDDQPGKLLSYQAILADLGENLVLTKSGREALQNLLKQEFALILLDVIMPDMDGFETATLIRQHPRLEQTPIIFVTAFSMSDLDRLKGYELGAVDYVFAPVVPEILRTKVSVFVELYRKRQELQNEIAERKQAEQELRSSREQLRNLSAYLESVREEERTHIAREIHDELGQIMTALKMDLSWLSKRLRKGQEPLLEKTQSMSKLVDMTVQTVQRISAELRPGLLDDLGLAAAIEWQTGQFRERTGIECEATLDLDGISLDRERSTMFFRILQEALTNVVRHAQATKVKIGLTRREHKLLLKVRDNGKGITNSQVYETTSLGLIGMRERARRFRGKVKIRGIHNKGTILIVSMPLESADSFVEVKRHDKSSYR